MMACNTCKLRMAIADFHDGFYFCTLCGDELIEESLVLDLELV